MTWLRKVRPLLLVLGGLLGVASLLGASHLLAHGGGGGTDATKSAAPTNGREGSGPIVFGYVDSDPSPTGYGLPPVLQSGEIVEVYVKPGQDVRVREVRAFGGKVEIGDRLYKFNTRILEAKLTEALRAVDEAQANVRKARVLQDQHKTSIEAQQLKVEVTKDKEDRTFKGFQLYERNFRASLPKESTPERVNELLSNDVKLFELETAYRTAVLEHRAEKFTLERLKTTDTGAAVAIAEAAVRRYEAQVEEARTAIDLCTVRAKSPGTVERINYWPGDVIGISTRQPVLVLVPAGPRVVRAEVEAEFANRVGPDKLGKEVTIYDNNDPKLTYKGVVKRIGTTFLPKRNGSDIVPNDTRVLEVLVEVVDPAPAGKTRLLVGQKVRVNFGQ
jgi:multidrug resistance efflux pump